jgi:DNA gyrase inhibitor GyrI
MNKLDVQIVRLEPQHVAFSYGFGQHPEPLAWDKMIEFVKFRGLDSDGQKHRYLGFNNPNPAPGSPNYGYEQWVTVSQEAEGDSDIKIKDFPGGLYAVTRCQLRNIAETWQALAAWREKSPYRPAYHQWLEELINPPLDRHVTEDVEIDLYLPISE